MAYQSTVVNSAKEYSKAVGPMFFCLVAGCGRIGVIVHKQHGQIAVRSKASRIVGELCGVLGELVVFSLSSLSNICLKIVLLVSFVRIDK